MAGEKMGKGLSFDGLVKVMIEGSGCKESYTALQNCKKEAEKNKEDGLVKVMIEGGGCKESYTALQNCKKEAEKNKEEPSINECYKEDRRLRECMEAHSDSYQPILKVFDAADERLDKEMKASRIELAECLIGGACIEKLMALSDCLDDDCVESGEIETLECMDAHPDDYQPFHKMIINAVEKDIEPSGTETLKCLIGGACKDTIVARFDCSDEDEDCSLSTGKEMLKCMYAHSDYYQPVLGPFKAWVEYVDKELQALGSKLSS